MAKRVSYLFLILVLFVNFLLSIHPAWQGHLHTDVNVYFDRVSFYTQNGSFAGLYNNEYLPGALIFLVALSLPFGFQINLALLTGTLFLSNIFLVLLLAKISEKFNNDLAPIILGLIFLFTGPIFYYRFDLFVMALVVTSFYAWKINRKAISLFLLSAATLTKIFPIIFVPYLLLLTWKNDGWVKTLKYFGLFFSFLLGSLAIFMLTFKMDIAQLASTINFLSQIPVHAESTWGLLLGIYSLMVKGVFVHGQGGWGTFGIAPTETLGPLSFYASAAFFAVGALYLWFLFKIKKGSQFDILPPLIIILTFLLFSRVLNHQYTLWFMLLLPLVPSEKWLHSQFWQSNLLLVLLTTFLHQYIYPLNYSTWVFELYKNGTSQYLFWLIILRNLLLFVLLWRLLRKFNANV